MGFRLTDDGTHESQDQPDPLVLQDPDRFHFILRSDEVALSDGVTMTLAIFVVRRAATGTFDKTVIIKFFHPDGTPDKTLKTKKGIPAVDVEKSVSTTASKFETALKNRGLKLNWEELDLRHVSTKGEQVKRINDWGIGRVC